MNKSIELKIDLKGINPHEILANVCKKGYYQIVKILLKKFEELKIDFEELTPKRSLAIACEHGYFEIVEKLLNKFVELKIDLNDLNDSLRHKKGKYCKNLQSYSIYNGCLTAFQIVCKMGYSKLAEMLILRSTGVLLSQRFFLRAHTVQASSLIAVINKEPF